MDAFLEHSIEGGNSLLQISDHNQAHQEIVIFLNPSEAKMILVYILLASKADVKRLLGPPIIRNIQN
jgi:hypothetical protein